MRILSGHSSIRRNSSLITKQEDLNCLGFLIMLPYGRSNEITFLISEESLTIGIIEID